MAQPPSFNPGSNLMRMNVRCPVCGHLYDLQRLKILGERDQQLLAYIDCHHCSTGLLSILSVSPSGMTAQGLVTDLTPDEIIDADEHGSINNNDVLDVHEHLESDHGNFFTQHYNNRS